LVDFFIKRPIFATVCALLIILAGAVCIPSLPISLYPNLAPPQVTVSSNFVGANAQVVESAVTIPLEQQINGVGAALHHFDQFERRHQHRQRDFPHRV
jgi:HAE1 family hydrophobic/amphiphilic exporter-1